MTKRRANRDLNLIASELQTALTRETADIVAIGNLLIEAHEQVEHGDWIPWLDDNFDASIGTADNYIAAARFAAKFPTVRNLKLRPTALYRLGHRLEDCDVDGSLYNRHVVETILKEAETKWVNGERVNKIASLMRPEIEEEEDVEQAAALQANLEDMERELLEAAEREEAALQSEIDDILEGQPPDLPPSPETTEHDVILPPFDQAVQTLTHLQTKSLAKFTGTAHSADSIRGVSRFLQEISETIDEKARQAKGVS